MHDVATWLHFCRSSAIARARGRDNSIKELADVGAGLLLYSLECELTGVAGECAPARV